MDTIGIFGAASSNLCQRYKNLAFMTGKILAQNGKTIITGGGPTGSMGEVINGALSIDEKFIFTIGITTHHLAQREGVHSQLSEVYYAESMNSRKNMVITMSDVILVLPGGFGTLDEMMEALTLQQIGLSTTPVVVLDTEGGVWADILVNLVDTMRIMGAISEEYATAFRTITIKELPDFINSTITNTGFNLKPKWEK